VGVWGEPAAAAAATPAPPSPWGAAQMAAAALASWALGNPAGMAPGWNALHTELALCAVV
jgi:hypothetical protein